MCRVSNLIFRLLILAALIFAGFSYTQPALAATGVCGLLANDTTWSLSGSPYQVCNTGVTIPSGKTLTIEAGVTVQFNAIAGNKLNVQGRLTAKGTPEQMITLTGMTASPGSWGGISAVGIPNTPATIELDYVSLNYGGLSGSYGAQVYADQAVVTITNSQINSSAGNGVYVSSSARLEAHSTDFNLNVQNAIRLMRENYERGLYEGEEYQYWQKVSAMKEKLDLLSRVPESAIERAARALLDLRESWEWVTKELARLMIQEIGVDMAARRVLWIKACPDFDMLFQVLENLRVDDKRRFWIEYQGADEDVCSIREDKGQMGLKVKTFASVVFHNVLTESRSTYNERNVLKK